MSLDLLPPNFDPNFAVPQLIITDRVTGAEIYRYEGKHLYPSGTQDFNMSSAVLHYGLNDDHGSLGIRIEDDLRLLTKSDESQECIIPRYSPVQLYLGKSVAKNQRWFYGKILKAAVIRPNSAVQDINLFCAGWGIKTADRLTNMREFQKLQSDNITPDSTDTTTRMDNLFNKLFQSPEHYPLQSLGIASEISSEPASVDFRQRQFEQRFQTWAHAASQMAGLFGGYWKIDYDRKAKLNKALSVNSGFLFTSDTASILTTNWNSAKLGLISGELSWTHDLSESGYNILLAHGVSEDSIDIDETGSENAVFDMSTKNVAAQIIPQVSTLGKIGIRLRRTGTPAENAFVSIMSHASGGPRSSDVIKRIAIPKEKLQALSDSVGTLVQIPLEGIQLVAGSNYYIVLEKYGTVSNTIEWEYETGSGVYYDADTISGTWSIQTGKFSLTTYPNKLTNVILVNTTALRKLGEPKETVIPLRTGMNQKTATDLMIGLAEVISKERRILPPIEVSIPDSRIPTGEYCLLTDSSGLKLKTDIIGVDVSINAFDVNESLGATKAIVTCQVYE